MEQRLWASELRVKELELQSEQADGRARQADFRAQQAELNSNNLQAKLNMVNSNLRDGENRTQDHDRRIRELEVREMQLEQLARDAEIRASASEGAAAESERRARLAEGQKAALEAQIIQSGLASADEKTEINAKQRVMEQRCHQLQNTVAELDKRVKYVESERDVLKLALAQNMKQEEGASAIDGQVRSLMETVAQRDRQVADKQKRIDALEMREAALSTVEHRCNALQAQLEAAILSRDVVGARAEQLQALLDHKEIDSRLSDQANKDRERAALEDQMRTRDRITEEYQRNAQQYRSRISELESEVQSLHNTVLDLRGRNQYSPDPNMAKELNEYKVKLIVLQQHADTLQRRLEAGPGIHSPSAPSTPAGSGVLPLLLWHSSLMDHLEDHSVQRCDFLMNSIVKLRRAGVPSSPRGALSAPPLGSGASLHDLPEDWAAAVKAANGDGNSREWIPVFNTLVGLLVDTGRISKAGPGQRGELSQVRSELELLRKALVGEERPSRSPSPVKGSHYPSSLAESWPSPASRYERSNYSPSRHHVPSAVSDNYGYPRAAPHHTFSETPAHNPPPGQPNRALPGSNSSRPWQKQPRYWTFSAESDEEDAVALARERRKRQQSRSPKSVARDVKEALHSSGHRGVLESPTRAYSQAYTPAAQDPSLLSHVVPSNQVAVSLAPTESKSFRGSPNYHSVGDLYSARAAERVSTFRPLPPSPASTKVPSQSLVPPKRSDAPSKHHPARLAE